MKLIVLGSGSSVPHLLRASSGYWVESDGGSVLLDCSAATVHRMAQENLDWVNLDAIWVSHFHLDHCGGVMPYLFGTKYAPQTQERTKPLRIFGGAGLKKLLDAFNDAHDYRLFQQPFPVEIIEVGQQEFDVFPGLTAATFSTPHKDESMAIRLTDADGASLVYTADTGFDEALASFASKTDLLVIECSFFKNKPVEHHLELGEAMKVIRDAEPKRAMLTHLYPEWDAIDMQEEIKKHSPRCEVIEAKDGLRLDI